MRRIPGLLGFAVLVVAGVLLAARGAIAAPAPGPAREDLAGTPSDVDAALGLVGFFRSAWVHQVTSDLDDGGRYRVDRLAIQAGPAWSPANGRLLALAFGYRYDGFHFDRPAAFGEEPWGEVNSYSLSLALKWALTPRWTVLAVPSVSSSAEKGAAFEDSITYGGLAGFTYRFSPRLAIGPGVGVQTQLEDALAIYPVLLVEWKITPQLTLETGSGLGATLGPGLALRFQPAKCWEASIGIRYDRLRFRLDDDGSVPGGIGQESSVGLFASVRRWFGPKDKAYVSILLGFDLAGSMRLEDPHGNLLREDDHDPALSIGIMAGIGF